MPEESVQRVRIRVKGLVQGVYYRASTRDQARALGLAGWVRNTADGAVELEAQGPPDAVTRLVSWCHKGPPAARVAGVDVTPVAVQDPAEDDFFIRR